MAFIASVTLLLAWLRLTLTFPVGYKPNGEVYRNFDIAEASLAQREVNSVEDSPFQNRYELALSPFVSETRNAELRLESFLVYLKGFINATGFDSFSFEKKSRKLDFELRDIQRSVVDISHHKDIKDRLRFIKHLFHEMQASARDLKRYRESHDLAHHLITCLVQMNVHILMLFNSHGVPDLHNGNLSGEVAKQMGHLRFWNGLFMRLKHVPIEVHLMYVNQYDRAVYTMNLLNRQIPEAVLEM